MAPTILDMMGIGARPSQMDGRSWLPQITAMASGSPASVGARDGAAEVPATTRAPWRTEMLIEYNGPTVLGAIATIEYPHEQRESLGSADPGCTADINTSTLNCDCSCTVDMWGHTYDKSPCDGGNNTFKCLRTISATTNTM